MGRARQTSQIGQAAEPGKTRRYAKGCRRQSWHGGKGMTVLSTPIRAMIAALSIAAAAPVALLIGVAVRSFVMFRRLATAALFAIAFTAAALAADTRPHRVAIQVNQNDPQV